jgi:hypothetical protein
MVNKDILKGSTDMELRERDIERSLAAMVKRHGGLCLKWTCPGWTGVPDRIILMPGGRIFFVELKRPRGGGVCTRQVWWRNKLEKLGFYHCFIWNHDDVDRFVAEVLGA